MEQASGDDVELTARDWGCFVGHFVMPNIRLHQYLDSCVDCSSPLYIPARAGIDALLCLRALHDAPVDGNLFTLLLMNIREVCWSLPLAITRIWLYAEDSS